MALAVYRLTVKQNYMGQACYQVYHFTNATPTASAVSNLTTEFIVQRMNSIHGLQNVNVLDDTVYAVNVDDPSDYHSAPITGAGGVGGTTTQLPPWLTWNFTFNTIASIIRHGYKRITGLDESLLTNGVPTSTAIGLAGTFAGSADNSLAYGGDTFDPVVARYNHASPPVVTGWAVVTSIVFKGVGHQVSRYR